MHIKPFRAVFPNLEYITSNDSFFGTVKEEYNEYLSSGFFNKDEESSLYVYQIRALGHEHTGIVACTDIEDYLEGLIVKQEDTLASKEQKQIQLLLKRKAIVKPVMLTYPYNEDISALTKLIIEQKEPIFDLEFESENAHHLIWSVEEPTLIFEFQRLFDAYVSKAIIADGHHRTSTNALLYQKAKNDEEKKRFGKLLSAFFPSNQIDILDFNRVVELDANTVSMTRLMASLSTITDIYPSDDPVKPVRKYEMGMFLNNEWYLLRWRGEIIKEYEKLGIVLDCTLLDELILDKILGIKDTKNDQRLYYVEGPKGIEGLVKRVQKVGTAVGFNMYPVQFEEMEAITDLGGVLPPKSTWFEPRMKNGLIVYDL